MAADFPPDRCPLCGDSNACGNLAGQSECWCTDTHVPRAAIEALPEGADRVACICERCALAYARPTLPIAR